MRYSATVLVNATPQRVFSYLADFGRHPEWAGNKLSVEAVDKGPVCAGWRFRSVGQQLGARADESVVTEFEPPNRLAFETNGDEGSFRNSFLLSDEGGWTRLTKTFEARRTRGLARLAQLVYPLIATPAIRRDVERIKAWIERTAVE